MKDEPKIIDTGLALDGDDFDEREQTDMIVIHHTGDDDIDASAKQIDQWHTNKDMVAIGYHYVIRKNGTIEEGRPDWAVGGHAYGENWHTIGIHLSGAFNKVQPTEKQIESCAHLVAYLCEKWGIPIDRAHIVGHREVNDDTSCPGDNLFAKLDLIVSKAAWYAKQEGEEREADWKEDMEDIKNELEEKERREMRYNTFDELPDWAKPTVKKIMDKKLLSGDGENLDLSADMIRVFVALDRNGTFD